MAESIFTDSIVIVGVMTKQLYYTDATHIKTLNNCWVFPGRANCHALTSLITLNIWLKLLIALVLLNLQTQAAFGRSPSTTSVYVGTMTVCCWCDWADFPRVMRLITFCNNCGWHERPDMAPVGQSLLSRETRINQLKD